jgi:hypothetical protein
VLASGSVHLRDAQKRFCEPNVRHVAGKLPPFAIVRMRQQRFVRKHHRNVVVRIANRRSNQEFPSQKGFAETSRKRAQQ